MLDWLACVLVKIVGAVLCALPPAVAVWLGERCGTLAFWLQPKRTRIGILNLRAAFDGQLAPSVARRIIRRCYQQMGAGVLELLRLPAMDRAYMERYVTMDGRQYFDGAFASGRPVVFLTGHFGNWELSSITAALDGHPVVVLARAQQKLPKLYRLLVSYRESKGCTVVHKGGAMRRLIAALDRRQAVGIVGDQASRQGIFVDFFGRPALFATGPFELAYKKQALIAPAFIHRTRGPSHRLVMEPLFELSQAMQQSEAVRQGIERFAALLARHIAEDPSQWLWMHKRWKHTTARRVLVLSDGKAGHLKQSLAVVETMHESSPGLSSQVVEVRYRHPLARLIALVWGWLMPRGWGAPACLRWTLTSESASALLRRYADLVVSCGSSMAPANVLWASDNRAKSVVIMNPTPLPLGRFDLVIAPRHDALPPRSNVIAIDGAMTGPLRARQVAESIRQLQHHPNFRRAHGMEAGGPVIAVLVGGETSGYVMPEAWVGQLIEQVVQACEAVKGVCLVTSSRRTPASAEQLLTERLGAQARCRLLLIASRDAINGTMEGILGSATVVVVTGESISMVSEACASGRRVIVVEPPQRHAPAPKGLVWGHATKHRRFLRDLHAAAQVRVAPVADVSAAIQRALRDGEAPNRLDSAAVVRDALARLL